MGNNKVLVAPLNWGLGHAARCIPIIKALKQNKYQPIIASDGEALELLKKEFPGIPTYKLPSYKISYTNKGSLLKWKLLLQSRHILKNIKKEKEEVKKLVEKHSIKGIISDNRWGAFHPATKNVFITHQLKVLSGITTLLTTTFHKNLIQNFDECWVPDFASEKNLSGILGHENYKFPPVKYIGPLSRFSKNEGQDFKYHFCVLLSGPEPQRGILENLLLKELQKIPAEILFIRGTFETKKPLQKLPGFTFKDHLYGAHLEKALHESKVVISRSGYTTIMDLAKLEKKAFFIPTPGQEEQLYLARRMKNLGFAPFCKQKNFSSEKLEDLKLFGGFHFGFHGTDFSKFFALFQGE